MSATLGTDATLLVFRALAYVEELVKTMFDATGMWGLYLVMVGSFISLTAILGPMVYEGISGSDRARPRDDDD